MNGGIVIFESRFKALIPDAVEFAETFADEAIERRVRSFLRATLDKHVDELDLQYLSARRSTYEA